MKNLIVGNWKMNPQTPAEAKKLLEGVKKGINQIKNTDVVVCPPFLYLSLLINSISGKSSDKLFLGSQNCSWEEKGDFTGEVSALMLKDLKINYIILGHSERRKYFIETDEIVNKKIKKALSAGLKIIFCIGETAEEKDAGKKSEVLEKQLKKGLRGISKEDVKKIVIAYEPVWSIGTGNNCSVNETMSSVLYIRKVVAGIYNRQITNNMKIIYGGSVKSENSGAYIKETGVNGLLVGGASLNAEEFIKIIKSAK